jgi:hypothetical protein
MPPWRARINAGWTTEIEVFYDRVARFPDRQRMPEFLGHVLAHEFVHILEGVARHSDSGLMKARWDDDDCAQMARKPLPIGAEDVAMLRARFGGKEE